MEKKHREKGHNTGKTQEKHREFYLSCNVATLNMFQNFLIKSFFRKNCLVTYVKKIDIWIQYIADYHGAK